MAWPSNSGEEMPARINTEQETIITERGVRTVKRYLSLAIGVVAILGTLFFLVSGLLAILVTFGLSAGLFPWRALILVVAGTVFGFLSGCGAVSYFFFTEKIKLYYTFPAWITVSLMIFGLFIGPMLDDMKQERLVRAFVEQNDPGVAFGGAKTRSRMGNTPLILATRDGDLDKVKALIDEGADMNLCDWYGRTPLFHASSMRIVDMTMIELLVSRGTDVNVHPSHGNTLLQESMRKKGLPEFLIRHGADVNVPTGSKIVPLNEAISSKNSELIQLLLENKADVNVHDSRHRTPLSLAVKRGWIELAEVLLAKGADIDACDINGDSLLSWSRARRKNDVVEFLIQHGADKNVRCGKGDVLKIENVPFANP